MNKVIIECDDDPLVVNMRGQEFSIPLWQTTIDIDEIITKHPNEYLSKVQSYLIERGFPQNLTKGEVFQFVKQFYKVREEIKKQEESNAN